MDSEPTSCFQSQAWTFITKKGKVNGALEWNCLKMPSLNHGILHFWVSPSVTSELSKLSEEALNIVMPFSATYHSFVPAPNPNEIRNSTRFLRWCLPKFNLYRARQHYSKHDKRILVFQLHILHAFFFVLALWHSFISKKTLEHKSVRWIPIKKHATFFCFFFHRRQRKKNYHSATPSDALSVRGTSDVAIEEKSSIEKQIFIRWQKLRFGVECKMFILE